MRTVFILTLGACLTACSQDAGRENCGSTIEPLLIGEPQPGMTGSPFPSDLYTVEADTPTGLRNDLRGEPVLFQQLVNQADGWAPHGPIRIRFSGGVAWESLPITVTASTAPDAALQLLDSDTLERQPFTLATGATDTVYLVPYRPLLEEKRYAIVVLQSVQPALAQCTQRSTRFNRIVNGEEVEGIPAHVRRSIREIYASIAAAGFGPDVALAVPYTTQSITRELLARRAKVTAAPITAFTIKSYPALETDGTFNKELAEMFPALPNGLQFGIDAKLDAVSHLVLGHFDTADYRANCRFPYGDYLWVLTVQCVETLEFLLALPKFSSIRPEYREAVSAAGRFPVIIFGHGLTACKETALAVANTFAEYGFAVAAIDVVEHGTRNRSDPGDACGETILEGLRMLRFAKPIIARDNLRQTALDQMAFIQMLVTEADRNYLADTTATDTFGKLQVERFGYIGQSLGSIIGTALTALEPRITVSVLNVPGGGMGDFVIAADEEARRPADVELLPDGMLLEALAAVQIILGPAEPLYYAPYATWATPSTLDEQPHKHMLVQQGMDDEVMPWYLTENLARALGAAHVEPVQQPVPGLPVAEPPYRGPGKVTVALQQYHVPVQTEPEKKDWNAHYMLSISNDPKLALAVQEQAARFLWTGLFEERAEVVDGYLSIGD